jgi:hypothetical protein
MVAMIAPGVAQGVTIDELLAQIAQLQAQLLALQGGTTPNGNVPNACSGITLSRTLVKGSTGSDVKCVQALLNTDAVTQIANSGPGSNGSETTYYGNLTVAAVKKFQAKYGTGTLGTVGPLTRAKMNSMLTGGTVIPPVVTPTGAGLTVALAANNPASGTIVDGQALAPLARLIFVNGDNAEVKVTGLKIKRIGISADASLTNVYLFDGATRLTDGAAVSSTVINFNNTAGVFTVPAGGSRVISVLADVNGDSGETMGVQVVAATDVTTNASSVKGTFPVTGNLFSLATGTLAGVEFNATTTPSDATIDPQNDYIVWQNSVIVTTRAVDMTRVSFRKTGSVKDADLQNFRLYVDGVQVGSAIPNIVLSANNESLVTFDLTASPKRLEAGTRVIKLMADIIGGSSLTFQFHLWNSADVTVVDSQYGANVLPDLISNAAFSKRSAGTSGMTVGSGTITFTKKADSPSGNIVDGASNATLAKFEVKAAGEKVKIETLYISSRVDTASVSGLRNGMLLANGVQIGSTTTLYDPADSSYDYTTFNLGSSLIVTPGSPVLLEIRADVYDTGTSDTTNSIVDGSTIQVVIEGANWNNATGQSSASTIDAPASDVSANSLTVDQGGLSLSKYTAYTDQTAVQPLTAYKMAHYTLTANTTESVNVTAINVTLDEVSSYISNLYVTYGNQTTSTKASVTAASNDWSVNYTIPSGSTIDMIVYGDVSTGNGQNGSGIVTMAITGTTGSSAVAANVSATDGQTTTYTSGTFATAFASAPQNQAVSGNQQVEAGRFKFTSSYQAYTITELRFNGETSATSVDDEAVIKNAILKDGSTVIATVPFNNTLGYFNFTGLSVSVPASTTKTLTLVWDLSIPSSTASTSGVDARAELEYVKYLDPNGTVATDDTTREANRTIVYRSVPTLSKVAITDSHTINNGQVVDLYKFKVTAPAQGEVNIKQFKLTLSWSDGGTADTPELESLKLLKDGVDLTTSTVSITEEDGGTSVEDTTGVVTTNSQIIVTWDSSDEDTIAAGTSTTYTIRGTPQGFRVNGATDTAQDSVAMSMTTDTAAQTDTLKYLNAGTSLTGIVKLWSDNVTGNGSAENATLIWSDNSAVAHSAAVGASSTGDWTNSYLVLDSLSSESWSR